MLVCAFLCASCTRDRGCSAHPAFPAPSHREGQRSNLGHSCRENAKVRPLVGRYFYRLGRNSSHVFRVVPAQAGTHTYECQLLRCVGAPIPFIKNIGGYGSWLSPGRRGGEQSIPHARLDGLLRGACHRARIRATRWLAMTRKERATFSQSSPANARRPVRCGFLGSSADASGILDRPVPATPTAFIRRRTSAVKRLRRGSQWWRAEALAKAASRATTSR